MAAVCCAERRRRTRLVRDTRTLGRRVVSTPRQVGNRAGCLSAVQPSLLRASTLFEWIGKVPDHFLFLFKVCFIFRDRERS